jgi:hypothetical protein
MISRLTVKAALVGFAASVALAAPANAATKLTLDAQTSTPVLGFSTVQLTGTATPGASVQLFEAAYTYGIGGIEPAKDFNNNNGPVTAIANAQGRFTIPRYMDSGFLFQVRSGSEISETQTFQVTQQPAVSDLASPSNNTVTVTIVASPGQPYLDAHLQKNIAGKWTTIGSAVTSEPDGEGIGGGIAKITATNVSGGKGYFRAYVDGDTKNAMLPGPSKDTFELMVGGAVTDPATPAPTPTKPAPTPTKPTTPAPKPTTPKPTPPKPAQPAVGSVQFTRIQYDPAGKDLGSNASLLGEWVKLTNKTKKTINLNGWTVRDKANHVYKFTGTVNLGAGKSIFVLTGKAKNTSTKKHWNRKGKIGYIWNNAGDTAYLRAPTGRQIDTCAWKSRGKGYSNC